MTDWIIQTISELGYLGIFLVMLAESIFPPIPSELIIPFAGFAAANGDLNLFGVLAAATIGAVVGMLPWYFAGRLFGLERVRYLADRFGRVMAFNADEIDLAVGWFKRFGPIIVLFGRLIPLIRTLISIPAGLSRMSLPVFLLASTSGALIWNTILTLAGYILHEHYEVIEVVLDPLSYIVLGLVVVLYLLKVATWKPSKSKV
ncbi:DedA family protein [Devosia psychrophila]|jgi:membrane protein DedA with SNARE-associated domain|uniref:Alkaline phosphatase n=1 Tax=Devosia psychrophila TaxID=728005 RepID=A0A0F5PSP8_9HYPH|nr:DedA family protein [Devosia psychrophila]KKC31668.1 alkaline phosphatase [Devosia psychrophila]SFB93687.1 membrane protein DedA, SNARE-associated domain [Devosia psychrophila]